MKASGMSGMKKTIRISVVVPTKNSARTLEACLSSIAAQDYRDYELIVVDGMSTDPTPAIARRFTDRVYPSDCGRSEARNLGFAKAGGDVFLSIDSDMVLGAGVLAGIAQNMGSHGSLIIPERGIGDDFISRCKDLEKRCYIGDPIVESARAFSREAFESVGGYDTSLVFGEDWDIHSRIKARLTVGRVDAIVFHDTRDISLPSDIGKAFLYGRTLQRYLVKGHQQARDWLDPRNNFYARHWKTLCRDPLHSAGLTVIKSLEYCAGIAGFIAGVFSGEPLNRERSGGDRSSGKRSTERRLTGGRSRG